MSLILHVGHGKTGTSAIQTWLANNRALLLEEGIHYPGEESDANALAGKINSGNRRSFERMTQFDDHTYLFSNENFFHDITTQTAVGEKIIQHSAQVDKVIIFTRDLFGMLYSSWGQSVKRGGKTHTIEEMASQFTFYNLLEKRLKTFESFNIPYELRNYSYHSKSIVQTFLTCVFNDEQQAQRVYAKSTVFERPVNRSMTLAEYELQRQFNQFYGIGSSGIISDALVNSIPDIPSEKARISEETVNQVIESNAPSIEFINTRLPDNEHIKTDYTFEFKEYDTTNFSFSGEQLKVLARQISASLKRRERRQINNQEVAVIQEVVSRAKVGKLPSTSQSEILQQLVERLSGSPANEPNKEALSLKQRLARYVRLKLR